MAPDDKFIPFLQSIFEEAVPNANQWRIRATDPGTVFSVKNHATQFVDTKYLHSTSFSSDVRNAKCLIFHSLGISQKDAIAVLRVIPSNLPIVWRGWGIDYYDYIAKAHNFELVMPETKEAMGWETAPPSTSFFGIAKRYAKGLVEDGLATATTGRLLKRINYFSCCVPDDYDSLKKSLPGFRATFLPLNYYSMEDVFLRGNNQNILSGRDILLGNSGNPTNNHLEAMRLLSRIGVEGRKVIVPLSYGGIPRYHEMVIRQGEKLLGKSFIPLTKFLTIQEYNTLISTCGNVMMNQLRQQGMGNISAALMRGAKVFLNRENPIYTYYSRMGVKIYSITEKLKSTDFDFDLDSSVSKRNREILSVIWTRKRGIDQAKALYETCCR